MKNEVFLDPAGMIHHVYNGNQTYETVSRDAEKIIAMARSLRDSGKRVLVLGNYTNIGKADAGARKAASQALKEADYDKAALFGTSVYHTVAANLIIMATGRGKKTRVFTTKEKALKWLAG